MATESGISILKKLFKNFFERSSRDYYEKIEKEKIKKTDFLVHIAADQNGSAT